MRELFDTSGPGKFEGESPIVAYLWELCANGAEDEFSGTSDAPTGWFARLGKWLITATDRGFVHGDKFPTLDSAREEFALRDAQFAQWDSDLEFTASEDETFATFAAGDPYGTFS